MSNNEKLKEDLLNNVLNKFPTIERNVLDSIFEIIDNLDYKGGIFQSSTISNDDIIKIQNAIRKTLKTSGYVENVEVFLQDIGKLTINTFEILDIGGFSFTKNSLSDIEKKWKNLTVESLLNSGMRNEFETPIIEIINNSISYGSSINEAKEQLKNFIVSGDDKSGKLKSYTTVTARDTIGQMQGQQMQSVADANGYEAIRYVGGLLEDSRGQCYRWVEELKGIIKKDKLKEEIKLAYKNQKEKKVTNGTHKWSGMMPNTDENNFIIKRGGYGCLHTAYPIKKVR